MIGDTRRENILSMRTTRQLEDVVDEDEEKRPTDKEVFETWRSVMLKSSTVTLTSTQQCTICLPFTTLLQKKVFNQDSSIPPDATYPQSAFWLARALAQSTELEFENRGDACFVASLDVT